MELRIKPNGDIVGVYGDEIPLRTLGDLSIQRASNVEWSDDSNGWMADLSPVGGPVLGPFERRTDAIEAEVAWLHRNYVEVN